jgi:hypothetical protein
LLVTTRQHKVKVADMEAVESREIGTFGQMLSYSFTKGGCADYVTRLLVTCTSKDGG